MKVIKIKLGKHILVSILKSGRFLRFYLYPEWRESNLEDITKLIKDLKELKTQLEKK